MELKPVRLDPVAKLFVRRDAHRVAFGFQALCIAISARPLELEYISFARPRPLLWPKVAYLAKGNQWLYVAA